jgi:hypothetical protein
MWRFLTRARNSDSVCLPTKIQIAFGSTQEVTLWCKGGADKIDSLVEEWSAVVDTLPELFGLPQGCNWDIRVVDDQGDVITLCA